MAPFSVAPVCHLDFADQAAGDRSRDLAFVAELWQNDQIVSRQTAFFVPTKHLNLTDPLISAQLTVEQGQFRVQLSAQSLARLVECELEGADVVFSDNYFDLPAGLIVEFRVSCRKAGRLRWLSLPQGPFGLRFGMHMCSKVKSSGE